MQTYVFILPHEGILRQAKKSKLTNGNVLMGRTALQGNSLVGMDMKDLIGTKVNGFQLVAVKIVVINFVADGVVMDNPA